MTTPEQKEKYTAAWRALTAAAEAYVATPEMPQAKGLADAASAYARAREANTKAPHPALATSEKLVPFGRSAGTSIAESTTADLRWVHARLEESIASPEKARWVRANTEMRDAIAAELAARGDS